MVHFSFLIPQRNAAGEVERLVPQLVALCQQLDETFEVICIDDGSQATARQQLDALRECYLCLRLLTLDGPCGLSAALTAGIAAARGQIVIALEASRQYQVEQIPWLIERLARADLVFGRRQRGRLGKLVVGLAQVPRRLLLGLEVRDPDCLFWAARREALEGLELARGMHRFLGSHVSTRGFRVAEIHVDHRPGCSYVVGAESWPSLGNLLATWWERRRYRAYRVEEPQPAQPAEPARPPLRIDAPQRIDPPRSLEQPERRAT